MEQDVGALQAVGEHEGFIGEKPGGGALGDEAAVIEQQDTRAELDDELEVVGGDDDRCGELAEELFELALAGGVEAAGGFVEDENFGIAGEDAGEADAAFFAEAQAVGQAVFEAGEAHLGEAVRDAGLDVGFGEAHLRGPKATSSKTVGQKSWSLGS